MKTSKEQVKLRKRKLKDGNTSLYLDIYSEGVRKYEFLKLYLVPERNHEDRRLNAETMKLANSVKAQRILDLQNGRFGFTSGGKTSFFGYFNELYTGRRAYMSVSSYEAWTTTEKHLHRYEPNAQITFDKITKSWIEGFKRYLENTVTWDAHTLQMKTRKPLSRNTKASYLSKLRFCMKRAFKDRIIAFNPMDEVEIVTLEEGHRMYLTVDEIRLLAATPCRSAAVRKAFFFSCLTGMRRCDIAALRWGDVHAEGGLTRIIFRQQKTGGQEYLDIAKQAAELMGVRGPDRSVVFDGFGIPNYTNGIIREWTARAGINKEITFHCARHSFAVMMLDLGTDIYTVSKLLGHRNLETTQIYAKVLDKNKQSAVAKIPDIF